MTYKFVLPSPEPEKAAQWAKVFREKHQHETEPLRLDINEGIVTAIIDGDVIYDPATDTLTLTTQGEANRMANRKPS